MNKAPGFQLGRRQLLAGGLMASTGVLAAARRPNVAIDRLGSRQLKDIVPVSIGPWRFVGSSGLLLPPEDQLASTLYTQMLMRVYEDGRNTPIMLLIAYGARQTGFLQVHRPEICYEAGGFSINSISPTKVVLPGGHAINANRMPATREDMTENVLYWTRVGARNPRSWAEQRLTIFKDNLGRIIPDAVLVRISIVSPLSSGNWDTLQNFATQMLVAMAPADRPVLVA